MSLVDLSVQRANLPTFPGATLPEQMVAGRNAALAILRLYKPDLAFDVDAASQNLRVIDGWAERNGATLEAVFADPNASALPEQVRLSFDNATAQQFVVAGFTMAAIGMGPWMSGAVAANTSEVWARDDAAARLRVFGAIVQMHQSGYLKSLFAQGQAAAGFGMIPVAYVVAIVVTTVLLAAVLAAYLYAVKQLEQNNRLMRDLCEKAQASGDQATTTACVEAAKGLQDSDLFGIKSIGKTVVVMAAIIGGIWLAATYGPGLLKKAKR